MHKILKLLIVIVLVFIVLVTTYQKGTIDGYETGRHSNDASMVFMEGIIANQEAMIFDQEETISKQECMLLEQSATINQYRKELDELIETVSISSRGDERKYNIDTYKMTAYSPYDNVSGIENDGNPNSTATGTVPKEGTMAVDPRVIPYGSTIIVVYEDGSVEFGTAEDCGGAIKGKRVDVFRRTYKETVKFGVRKATVIWFKKEVSK